MLPAGSQVVGYARVSTDDQADKGSSMRAQPEVIIAHCQRQRWDLVEVVADGGESSKTMDRAGLRKILGMLDANQVQGVVVANVDRLTRNLADACALVDHYFTAPGGKELISVGEPVETRTAVGRMQFFILLVISQYQREAGVERTRNTLRSKRNSSERLGRDQFGKRTDPTNPARSKTGQPIGLEDDPDDLAATLRIYALADASVSLREMARLLDLEGYKPKRGRRWAASTVQKILKAREQA